MQKAFEALRCELAQGFLSNKDSDGVFDGLCVGAFDLAEDVGFCLQVWHSLFLSATAILVETLFGKDHVIFEEQLD